MSDTELFNLCKEVYKALPNWNDTQDYIEHRYVAGELVATEVTKNAGYEEDGIEFGVTVRNHVPLFTSDYLLEKLLPITRIHLYMKNKSIGGYGLLYDAKNPDYLDYDSDTPLRCLLKLTLSLHKAGELKDV